MESEIAVIEQTALSWPERAEAITIVDQSTYDLAAKTLIEIAEFEKRIKDHHAPVKTAAHNAHKAAVAAEKKFLDPLTEAKTIIKRSISGWEIEQRRIREDAEKKARAEAEKKEEDARLARAEAAEKAGKSATEVEEILDTPAEVKVEAVKPTFIPSTKVGTRETWKAEIVDIKALCQAVAEGKVPSDYVVADMTRLNAAARLLKADLEIPGIKAVKETGIVTR